MQVRDNNNPIKGKSLPIEPSERAIDVLTPLPRTRGTDDLVRDDAMPSKDRCLPRSRNHRRRINTSPFGSRF